MAAWSSKRAVWCQSPTQGCSGLHYPEFLSLRGSCAWKASLRATITERIPFFLQVWTWNVLKSVGKKRTFSSPGGEIIKTQEWVSDRKQGYFQYILGVNHHHHHHHLHNNCGVWPRPARSYKRLVISSPSSRSPDFICVSTHLNFSASLHDTFFFCLKCNKSSFLFTDVSR